MSNPKSKVPERLAGKVAVVTGGSRGIGAAIVRRLAQEKAEVAFTYLKEKDAANAVKADIEAEGSRVLALRANSGNAGELTGVIDKIAKEFGRIDFLVNSAGALLFKLIDEFTLDDFDRIVAVDLKAAFVASRAALKHMKEGGRIVFISSNIADFAALPTTSFYSMVKSGLDGLAKGMARDLGPRGITVNTVHPGPINTDANPENGKYGDQLRAFMATPKFGTGEDVAAMVAFLVSPEARFATGAAFVIDNGFTA